MASTIEENFLKILFKLDMVVYTYNPSTQEAEAGVL
jgi:hypothetical protein